MRIRRLVWGTLLMLLSLGCPHHAFSDEAVAPEPQTLTLLKEAHVTDGVAPPTDAQGIVSEDPSVHLNYATILFYKGLGLWRSDQTAGEAILKGVERELTSAIRLSASDTDEPRRNLLRSQCAYLLGDLYTFAFKEPAHAKAFYQQAVRYFPEHTAAVAALKRFE